MKRLNRFVAFAAQLVLLASPIMAAATGPANNAHIDPQDFKSNIDNPFFPLQPGTTFIYSGFQDRSTVRDEFAVTHNTVRIDHVTCRVIHDQVFLDGILEEDTFDYFAQDSDGNVWYFGEDTKELDANGNVVSTEGTWRAGVDSAQPGIIMEAHPNVGDHYFQEMAPPVALDEATVLSLSEKVKVPFGTFTNCLETEEFTQLEPGNVEHKYYASGVGFLRSVVVKGGHERLELVNITTGN